MTASEDVLRKRYTTRLAVTGDTTPYEIVITHENEVASRGLISIAELVLVTLSQDFEPFGNRTTGMIWPRGGARSTCREEEQIH